MQTSCTAKVCEGQHYGAPSPLTTAYLSRAGRGTTDWLTFVPLAGHYRGEGTRAVWFKWLLMLKVVVLLLATCLQAGARGYSQGVTITAKDSPLKTVFQKITEQTGYPFLYNDQALEKTSRVTVSIKNATLEQALDQVLKGQPLTYTIVNKTIIVRPKTGKQNVDDENGGVDAVDTPINVAITVRGRVVNEDGEPVAGATVAVKGTNNATSTNENGEFVLSDVAADAVLVVTGVNIRPYEVKVNGRTSLSIRVQFSVAERETVRVVNTGYQRIRKERFVGSYSQLDSANFHRRAGMGIIERLNGTVPAVLFDSKSTQFPILIRGISTLGIQNTNTNPLIVVDNFPTDERFDINSINPNDVESITVLKDAAAASIWGTRAGNGVIVITTKRGRFNQPFNLTVNSNVTMEEKPDLFYVPRINTSDFIDVEQFLFSKGLYDAPLSTIWQAVSPVVNILDRQRQGLISAEEAESQINDLRQSDLRNDLDQYVYRESVRQQHHINVSGGSNTLAYRFSLGYNRSLNNFQGSRPDQLITFNSFNTFQPTRKLQFETGISFSYGIQRSNSINVPFNTAPYERLADDNGNPLAVTDKYRLGYIDTAGSNILLDWRYRPLQDAQLADYRGTNRLLILNFGTSYEVTNWLKAQVQYQFVNNLGTIRNHQSIRTYAARDIINLYTNPNITGSLRYPVPRGGILDLNNSQSQKHDIRGTLNFNKRWNADHAITALVGGELSEGRGYSNAERFYGYNDAIGTYNAAVDYVTRYPQYYAVTSPGQVTPISISNYGYFEEPTSRFVSVLANASYTYKDRYNLYASARRDGANVFGVNTNNKWKPLWSVGGSWELSREHFYQIDWLPVLRLRTSYGYLGNVNNRLGGLLTMRYITTPDFFSQLIYARANRAPNPDLQWETVKSANVGVDFQLLKRLSGGIELYQKNASDIISELLFPTSSGVEQFTVNASSLRTRGFELNLNSVNIDKAINWTTGFNLSYAKTIVTEFFKNNLKYNRAQDFVNYAVNPTEGEIAYGISSYRWAGLDPITGDPQGYVNGQVSKNYGAIFRDTIQNQVFHGSALPLYTSFLRNDVSWKGLTLSFNITGRFKYFYRKPTLDLNYTTSYGGVTYIADYYNRWQKPGDEAFTNIPSMPYPNPSGMLADRNTFYQYAEVNVRRGDNIRLQDIRLSYSWTNKNSKRVSIQNAQIFLYPNNLNLIIWRMEDDHYDPDVYGNGIPLAPSPKTWTAGVVLNF
jgi:TonB-linked SusC/RagA family outer membrane protein